MAASYAVLVSFNCSKWNHLGEMKARCCDGSCAQDTLYPFTVLYFTTPGLRCLIHFLNERKKKFNLKRGSRHPIRKSGFKEIGEKIMERAAEGQ